MFSCTMYSVKLSCETSMLSNSLPGKCKMQKKHTYNFTTKGVHPYHLEIKRKLFCFRRRCIECCNLINDENIKCLTISKKADLCLLYTAAFGLLYTTNWYNHSPCFSFNPYLRPPPHSLFYISLRACNSVTLQPLTPPPAPLLFCIFT